MVWVLPARAVFPAKWPGVFTLEAQDSGPSATPRESIEGRDARCSGGQSARRIR